MEDDYYGMRMNLDIIKHYSVKPAILPAFATDENEGVFCWQSKWLEAFFNYKWGNCLQYYFLANFIENILCWKIRLHHYSTQHLKDAAILQ